MHFIHSISKHSSNNAQTSKYSLFLFLRLFFYKIFTTQGEGLKYLLLEVCAATTTLLDLNLAGNSIGSWSHGSQREHGMASLCAYVTNPLNPLIHLNISRNMLNQKFGSRFNEALKTNFTLMGLHCEGNKFRTNAIGFVVEAGNRFDRGTFSQKFDEY